MLRDRGRRSVARRLDAQVGRSLESRSRRWCSPPLSTVRVIPDWPPAVRHEEIERLRAEPREGDLTIGGATLAAEAAAAGLRSH